MVPLMRTEKWIEVQAPIHLIHFSMKSHKIEQIPKKKKKKNETEKEKKKGVPRS